MSFVVATASVPPNSASADAKGIVNTSSPPIGFPVRIELPDFIRTLLACPATDDENITLVLGSVKSLVMVKGISPLYKLYAVKKFPVAPSISASAPASTNI